MNYIFHQIRQTFPCQNFAPYGIVLLDAEFQTDVTNPFRSIQNLNEVPITIHTDMLNYSIMEQEE